MLAFNKFFTSVFLAVVYASIATATTIPTSVKHQTHRVRSVGRRGLEFETFHPESSFQVLIEQ